MSLRHEELSRSVIGAFYAVYNTLGYGFLESLYSAAMEHELRDRGHRVDRELPVTVCYRGRPIGTQRLDLVVDSKLVIEIKSTSALHASATRQLYNYLHATRLETGLLFHFGPEPRFYRVAHFGTTRRTDETDQI
ncbi:GxxExxY protein [Roseisolibacter sp. H3M3-2]|uniref:GxxExxY protein n=1 Tax=Roseisolibacter sp. H3M3-2 TaxID=3031323 RepID=UPI0023DC7471|nr:GxxExxY protein [Roseisolibacter sp. H3M3-2]MDF1504608.1 GxxExxY protein [Roseisolibacter sp. H3M3-2]